MIKNIFRGFGYNVGKFLFYLFIVILLGFIINFFDIDLKSLLLTKNVYAANSWGALIIEPEEMYIQHTLTSDPYICTDYQNTSYLCTMPSGKSSEIFSWNVPRLKAGRSYTAYVDACYNQNVTSSNGGAFINGSNSAFANLQGGTITLNGAPSGTNFSNGCYRYWVNFDTNTINHTEFSFDIFQLRISKGTGAINMYVYDFGVIDNGLGTTALTGINNNINNSIASVNNNINNVTNNITNSMEEVNNSIQEQINVNKDQLEQQKETNNLINDDSVDLDGKFDVIEQTIPNYGIENVVKAPLNFLRNLSSGNYTCTPIVAPIPFTDKELELPCMGPIITANFGVFVGIYQALILSLISYWVCINTYRIIKNLANPEDDKIEVLDL